MNEQKDTDTRRLGASRDGSSGENNVGKGGQIHSNGWKPDLGGEHTTDCTDGKLCSCIPETHVMLLTRVSRYV